MLVPLTSFVFKVLFYPLKLLLKEAIAKAIKRAKRSDNTLDFIHRVDEPKGRKIAMTLEVPRELELDFLNYRSETYLKPMTSGVAHELALMVCGKNRPKPPTNEVVSRMFLSSAGALMTRWLDEESCYFVDFKVMKAPVWQGYSFDIESFKFNPEKDYYLIKDVQGNTYEPDHARWSTALNHLVYQYSVVIPMASHNWVHFTYPDSFAAAVFKKLNRDSVLYKLLYPHTRFTNRINNQAVYVQKSTDNSPSFKNKITPWKCFPVYGSEFREGVLENTANHYDEFENHCRFPERMDTRIPYFDFLKHYYDVIENFVNKVTDYIDEDDYERIQTFIESVIPGFSQCDKVKCLSILIWQVSVLHTTEHMSYYDLAKDYGFTELKYPISECFKIDEVSNYNRYKLRCFLNVFGRFNPSKILDQRIENYHSYQFEKGSELEKYAIEFVANLRAVDAKMKKENNQILELNKIVQSVCF
ncbi:hypothetical protein [Pleionea sediminis]|uniref:hypothetical protein n=1 Tax=Pleionea sediminis TaxID=2569479 RepID=UPI001185465D|nr:hypothetical protein [Pleionea sediminis]